MLSTKTKHGHNSNATLQMNEGKGCGIYNRILCNSKKEKKTVGNLWQHGLNRGHYYVKQSPS